MATSDQQANARDRPTPSPRVVDELEQYRDIDDSVRRLLEYLRGDRTANEITVQADIVPALQTARGTIAVKFEHTRKTEYVWPARDHDAVASCYHDNGTAFTENVPFNRDELAYCRNMPEPDAFVHVDSISQRTPSKAIRGDD